ncbi:MAG: hypothetical protein ACK46M_22210 [Planctomyces sp.]|jgi:hypothetical protein
MRLLRRVWRLIWGPPAPVRNTGRTVDEDFADVAMRRLYPQQWAHTQGSIEQRLQAMLIARNEDGQPCWSEADWKMIYGCLKGVQDSGRAE